MSKDEHAAMLTIWQSEILIWGSITKEAVLCDFSFSDLQKLCRTEATVRSLFKLDILRERGNTDDILRKLKANAQDFEPSITGIARFLAWLFSRMSFTPVVHPQHIAKFVSDICNGWSVRPDEDRLSVDEWAAASEMFTTQLGHRHASNGRKRAAIKSAFIFGLQSSYGDHNWQHSEKAKRTMLGRARKAGLDVHAVGIVLAERALEAQESRNRAQSTALQGIVSPPTPDTSSRRILQSVLLTPPPSGSPSSALSKLRAGYTLTEEDMVAIRLIGLD